MRFTGSLLIVAAHLSSCSTKNCGFKDTANFMEVSVADQTLGVYQYHRLVKTYSIATSKYGLGDTEGSYKTPLGRFEVAKKIGEDLPFGAVFRSRRWTGEILEPNSPGRDPIVSRILWLNGLEAQNKNSYERYIYIHGTAAEREVGAKTSYGCIRMKSSDIIELFDMIEEGTELDIMECSLWFDDNCPEAEIMQEYANHCHQEEGQVEEPFFRRNEYDYYISNLYSFEGQQRHVIPPPPVPPSREGFEKRYFEIEPAEHGSPAENQTQKLATTIDDQLDTAVQ